MTELEKVWGNGFTKIMSLKNDCDNIGVYLTAYITDMEISEMPSINIIRDVNQSSIKSIIVTESGEKVEKSFIKGLRLTLYPKGCEYFVVLKA